MSIMDLNGGEMGSDLSFFLSFSCLFFVFAVRRESGFSLSLVWKCTFRLHFFYIVHSYSGKAEV